MTVEIFIAPLAAGLNSLLEYLSAHVLTCLIPAFFIAGAIAALLHKETVLKYFGADARKLLSYSVAASSGTILAVCSCTILPMFAGIYRRGAGIGPATAFLYSGPAINLLAIVLTARVLGFDLGVARVICAVAMAIVVGLIMAAIFDRDTKKIKRTTKIIAKTNTNDPNDMKKSRPEYISFIFLALLVVILLVAASSSMTLMPKMVIVIALLIPTLLILKRYYMRMEKIAFGHETWWLFKRIFPLLIIGTFITGLIGFFLPVEIIRLLFGSDNFLSCLTASVIGAVLYMPTLLEVPIVGTLFGYSAGIMAPGPALSLLLAGPSLSLPNMMVILRTIGSKKTTVYIGLVVILSSFMGMLYGAFI